MAKVRTCTISSHLRILSIEFITFSAMDVGDYVSVPSRSWMMIRTVLDCVSSSLRISPDSPVCGPSVRKVTLSLSRTKVIQTGMYSILCMHVLRLNLKIRKRQLQINSNFLTKNCSKSRLNPFFVKNNNFKYNFHKIGYFENSVNFHM